MNDKIDPSKITFEDCPVQSNRLSPEDRYVRDAAFHVLVDQLRFAIERADYTPTEIREAAIFAAILVEKFRPARPLFVPFDPAPEGIDQPRCSRCRRSDCWSKVNGSWQCQNCGTYRRKY